MPTLNWVFTLHNYEDSDINWFNNYDFQYIVYGKEECPTTGRKHLQGYFQLKKPAKILSFPPFKNTPDCDEDATPLCRSKWFRPAYGTDEEASKYCKKDGDFFEQGERKPHKGKGCRSDLQGLKDAIDDGKTYEEICAEFFGACARYNRFIQERIAARDSQSVLAQQRLTFSEFVLHPWQQSVVDQLNMEVHPREVNWVWETVGNTGKSTLASYLEVMHDALVLEPAGKKDLAYIISQTIGLRKIVIFDLARCQEPDNQDKFNPLAGLYNICEGLKNGCITNTKYESKRMRVNVPHVWVFANFLPDMTKWSKDRYKIYNIEENNLIPKDEYNTWQRIY